MELLSLPVKAQFFGSKICYKSPSYSTSVKFYQKVTGTQFSAANGIRVRSEFDHKVNGAFSPDSDARFLDRQKALEAAMNDINSSFGKGSVTRLGSAGGALVETFPSGCLTLDFALGGGLPKGRIVEIYGPESSGKTTLALHAIAEVQVQYVFGLFYPSVWNFYRHGPALGREEAIDNLDEKQQSYAFIYR